MKEKKRWRGPDKDDRFWNTKEKLYRTGDFLAVCHFCNTLKMRTKRIARLVRLNAPVIIFRNEKRMIYDGLRRLREKITDFMVGITDEYSSKKIK